LIISNRLKKLDV